jgi:hypothetical protein
MKLRISKLQEIRTENYILLEYRPNLRIFLDFSVAIVIQYYQLSRLKNVWL